MAPQPPSVRSGGARGFRLFTLAGVEVWIDISWILSLILMSYYGWVYVASAHVHRAAAERIAESVAFGLALALCILVHEFAHTGVARIYGLPVRRIRLFALGGVSQIRRDAPTPTSEYCIALAEPLASVVIGAAFAAIARTGSPHERGLAGAWGALGYLNVLLAMFNLIPAFPLDGGRMLRSALWAARKNRRWATHWAAVTGRGFAAALMAGGVASIAFPSVRGNAWGAVIIGAFLFGVASSADRNAHDTDDEERTP